MYIEHAETGYEKYTTDYLIEKANSVLTETTVTCFFYHGFATELVRRLSFARGQKIKTLADSTLYGMKKEELIERIRILEHNYNAAVCYNENQARYIEKLLKDGDGNE